MSAAYNNPVATFPPIPEDWKWEDDPDVMNLSAVAKRLGISRKSFYQWLQNYTAKTKGPRYWNRKRGLETLVRFKDMQVLRQSAGLSYGEDTLSPTTYSRPQALKATTPSTSIDELLNEVRKWLTRPGSEKIVLDILELISNMVGSRRLSA